MFKDKAKLAGGVSKMLGALKARGGESLGLSPASAALQPPTAAPPPMAAPFRNANPSTRTPSRERFSTPGSISGGYSDDDTKSFNRSQMSMGRQSLGTVLPDGDRVFDQGGFGSRGVSPDIPQIAAPRPVEKQQPPPKREASRRASGGSEASAATQPPQQRRTPARQPSQQQQPQPQDPLASARSNKSDGPGTSRSTPPTAGDASSSGQNWKKLQPRKEDRYQADVSRQAEPSRKEQLRDGKEGRRSAPRQQSPTDNRREEPPAARSSSTSRTPRPTDSNVSQSRTPRGSERQSGKPSLSAAASAVVASNPASRSGSQRQTPERNTSQPRSSGGGRTPRPGERPTDRPERAEGTTSASRPRTLVPGASAVLATTGPARQTPKRRESPPNVDVARPAPKPLQLEPSSPVSHGNSSTVIPPHSPTLGDSQSKSGGVGIRRKVTGAVSAINAMKRSTPTPGPGERLGGSRGNYSSPSPLSKQSPPPGFGGNLGASPGQFSLANFIQETNSGYDFNRAPSRMSMGGSQYGGSDSGVSTPVHIRGASLMDAVGESKFPSKTPPSSTAGIVDLGWIDGTTKVTTAHGIETSEIAARRRIAHAGLFRPKVWFFNEILPGLRQNMLKEFASYKRRAFIECAEPHFRQIVFQNYVLDLRNIRVQFDENLDRLELERATVLWRSQVKNAFDRLVQQLTVERKRKSEEVKLTVEQELVKAAHVHTEKTSFSFLHLHQQFGEMLLKRTKELYVFYFGIFSSMNLKEEKERASIASEQRFQRQQIEMERVRFFIAHLEGVEYENIMKYFNGEKRILENELRFKPKPRNTAVPALNASTASSGGGFGIRSALGAPLHAPGSTTNSAAPTPYGGNNSTSATPYRQTPATFRSSNNNIENSFDRARKETQSPFPLDALERQMPARQKQQQQHEAYQRQEMDSVRSTPVMWNSPPKNTAVPPMEPMQHQYPSSYQQPNPLAALKEREKQQDMAAAQQMLSRMPAPAMMSNLERRAGSQAYDRLGKAMQWDDDGRSSVTQTPSAQRQLSNRTPHGMMGTEERRRWDDESDASPLPPPVRGGGSTHPLMPKLPSSVDGNNRKTREVSEGVINGLLMVSNVMNTNPTAADYGGRLPPMQHAPSVGNTQAVVSSIGRALLGPSAAGNASSFLPAVAAAAVPSFEVDERQVAQTEMDTAVALLLLLHKSGADAIASAELGVRQSVAIHEQEHRRMASEATAVSRSNRFLGTRLAKLLVEEQEDRHELLQAQRHEFCLHIQRQQWVEYFFMTTDESAERERIVGMSHLSLAIVGRNAKKEFGMTCLMQHQVLCLQQLHQYQRWFLGEVEHPTSAGLIIDQNERRERNRLSLLYQRETKLMEEDERRFKRRSDQKQQKAAAPTSGSGLGVITALQLETEALCSVEEVHRRNLSRQFTESLQRLTFELQQEGMARAVLVLARERWFNDLVRPSQHRAGLAVAEQHHRDSLKAQYQAEHREVMRDATTKLVEQLYNELIAEESRERRRFSLHYLKERRQREAVERTYQQKAESMDRYVQGQQYGASPQGRNPVLGEALNKYFAATNTAAERQTPSIPDYTSVIRKVKLQQQQQIHH